VVPVSSALGVMAGWVLKFRALSRARNAAPRA
jgi:hypothetical protein